MFVKSKRAKKLIWSQEKWKEKGLRAGRSYSTIYFSKRVGTHQTYIFLQNQNNYVPSPPQTKKFTVNTNVKHTPSAVTLFSQTRNITKRWSFSDSLTDQIHAEVHKESHRYNQNSQMWITCCGICLLTMKSDSHFHNFVICLPFPFPRTRDIMM